MPFCKHCGDYYNELPFLGEEEECSCGMMEPEDEDWLDTFDDEEDDLPFSDEDDEIFDAFEEEDLE